MNSGFDPLTWSKSVTFCCYDKYPPNPTHRRKGFIWCMSYNIPSRKKSTGIKTEPGWKQWIQDYGRMLLTHWLNQPPIFYSLGTASQTGYSYTNQWLFKCPTDMATGQSNAGNSLVEIFSSPCVNLTIKINPYRSTSCQLTQHTNSYLLYHNNLFLSPRSHVNFTI